MGTPSSSSARSSGKSERVFEHLSRVVENAEPNTRLPSVRALMTRFAVSQATVTAAIYRLEQEGALYRRQGSGIYSSPGANSRPLLLLVDGDSALGPSSFWCILVKALQDLYADHPNGLEIHFTRSMPYPSPGEPAESFLSLRLAEAIRNRKYSGVFSVCQNDAVLNAIREADLPSVGFACAARYQIHMAYLEACQLAISALAALDCKSLGLYKPIHATSREVFMASLRAHGLTEVALPVVDPPPLFRHVAAFHRIAEQGYWSAMAAFGPDSELKQRPEGIVILDDMFAQGYLSALQRLGIRVGRDLQVASTVNAESPSLLAWEEQIVSVRFSVLEIATVMHTAMDALQQGEEPADSWEQATWNLETGGLFRVAMLIPKVYVPEAIRQCINTIKH